MIMVEVVLKSGEVYTMGICDTHELEFLAEDPEVRSIKIID